MKEIFNGLVALLKRLLRVVSLGKYPTVFYDRKTGSASYSSVLGGLISLVLFAILGSAILVELIAVFAKTHWNQDISIKKIQALREDGNLSCDSASSPECFPVTYKDFDRLLSQYRYYVNGIGAELTDINCNQIIMSINIASAQNTSVTDYYFEGQFEKRDLRNATQCILNPGKLNITRMLSEDKLNEPMFK